MTLAAINGLFAGIAMASRSKAEYERFTAILIDILYDLEFRGAIA